MVLWSSHKSICTSTQFNLFKTGYPFWRNVQTVQTQFRRRKTRLMIRVYTACLKEILCNIQLQCIYSLETPKIDMDSSTGLLVKNGSRRKMLISVSIFCSIAKRQKFEKQIVWSWQDNRQIESIIGLRSEKPEKSLPEDKRILSEMRFSEFSALSVYPKVGFSHSASVTND